MKAFKSNVMGFQNMNVKFGACEFALPGCSVGTVKLAKEVGLDGLQLDLGSYERGYALSQKRVRDYYKEECEKYKITIPSILLTTLDVYGLRRPKGTEKGDMLYRILDMAAEAAIDMKVDMIMLPSFNDGRMETEEDIEVSAKALKYLCRMVASDNIMVTSENTLSVKDCKKLLGLAGEKNLSIFYDSQNYTGFVGWHGPDILEELMEEGLLYPELHVKDGIGSSLSSKPLGEGDSDFYGTISVLKKKGYQGWIHTENLYDRPPLNQLSPKDYVATLQKDIEILKQACA